MVTFNELRITPDGKKLIIDVSVSDLEYYENVYLDSIQIDTQDTFIESGPSSNTVYTKTVSGDSKFIRLELDNSDLLPSLNDNIFFVYVRTKGTPSSDTPCGMDNYITRRTVINVYPIYCATIQYLKELNHNCEIPKGIIDMYIKFKALELGVKTGNYSNVIDIWNKYFKGSKYNYNSKTSGCGCNN